MALPDDRTDEPTDGFAAGGGGVVDLSRRRLLAALPALAVAAGAPRLTVAAPGRLALPTVDRLALTIVVDAQVSAFAEPV